MGAGSRGLRESSFPSELLHRLPEFAMGPRMDDERNAFDRGLPSLLYGHHARRRTGGMADNPATTEIEQIDGAAGPFVGLRRLAAPLAGAGDRHRAILGR